MLIVNPIPSCPGQDLGQPSFTASTHPDAVFLDFLANGGQSRLNDGELLHCIGCRNAVASFLTSLSRSASSVLRSECTGYCADMADLLSTEWSPRGRSFFMPRLGLGSLASARSARAVAGHRRGVFPRNGSAIFDGGRRSGAGYRLTVRRATSRIGSTIFDGNRYPSLHLKGSERCEHPLRER
jgi:hypothetical protein